MSTRTIAAALIALWLGLAVAAYAQHQHDAPKPGPTPMIGPPATVPPATAKKPPLRVTMEEMHHGDGVPSGWRFTWPDGDAQKGREVFAKLECYQCPAMPGAGFPDVKPDPTRQGPSLASMGGMHPAEYFAESVLNPNAVIVTGPGFTGPDGLSIMPDYRDSLTLAETIDLVAYLRSLTGGGHHAHDAAAPPREQVTADYRVRVAYTTLGAHETGHAHEGAQSQHAHGSNAAAPAGPPRCSWRGPRIDPRPGAGRRGSCAPARPASSSPWPAPWWRWPRRPRCSRAGSPPRSSPPR